MPRLFTGIEIPDELRRRLAQLRGGLQGARWADPDDYHLTLRFVGDIDLRTANDIAEMLGRVQRPGFPLAIEGLGTFGGRKPHAVIAQVAPSRALAELQAEHDRLIQRLGLPPEPRKFTPHVTLARLRGTTGAEAAEYLALRGGFTAGPIPVGRFVLFSARDAVGGGPYVVEEAYPLLARAAA
ncbi:MAG: RNA 2',3'-cyclic phosphodiesterase [Bauldia sp.]|nr:RNA 2',3'-cyclic phosphodiesterase [Bauldia sp.]